eukprot:CAMPEP_0115847780 /NCGR_PEP_ID=MMETSP0287-20121206/10564_1 /TAXON_ID=412157 /ORGANISM="Chrysochromulina rotalis, Strain UIO044" /LENGTH=59 /DNA_ID=CAMNT_0003301635 /DNA_START=63 /DNA_END=242 /DNA_ORIENTATION=+
MTQGAVSPPGTISVATRAERTMEQNTIQGVAQQSSSHRHASRLSPNSGAWLVATIKALH